MTASLLQSKATKCTFCSPASLVIALLLTTFGCGTTSGTTTEPSDPPPPAPAAVHPADQSHAQSDVGQAQVAAVGEQVMPFDLDRTIHVFEKNDTGGVQQVFVKDESDTHQVTLVQQHLEEISERFSRGDFHQPEMIHGHTMPGLHELVEGHTRLDIKYSALENGAQIRYSSADPKMVKALHKWFDAQVNDHGDHARSHP